jgi:hypothetical protein
MYLHATHPMLLRLDLYIRIQAVSYFLLVSSLGCPTALASVAAVIRYVLLSESLVVTQVMLQQVPAGGQLQAHVRRRGVKTARKSPVRCGRLHARQASPPSREDKNPLARRTRPPGRTRKKNPFRETDAAVREKLAGCGRPHARQASLPDGEGKSLPVRRAYSPGRTCPERPKKCPRSP